MNVFLKIVGFLSLCVFFSIPLLVIWSCNILWPAHLIPYTITTYMATSFLISLLISLVKFISMFSKDNKNQNHDCACKKQTNNSKLADDPIRDWHLFENHRKDC